MVIIVKLFSHALVHFLYEDKQQELAVQFVPLEAASYAMKWTKNLQPPSRGAWPVTQTNWSLGMTSIIINTIVNADFLQIQRGNGRPWYACVPEKHWQRCWRPGNLVQQWTIKATSLEEELTQFIARSRHALACHKGAFGNTEGMLPSSIHDSVPNISLKERAY